MSLQYSLLVCRCCKKFHKLSGLNNMNLSPGWYSSTLSMGLWTKGSLVQLPVGAHAWVVGQVPGRRHARGNHILMFLSLYFSLPSPLSKNKYIKFKKKKPWTWGPWSRWRHRSLCNHRENHNYIFKQTTTRTARTVRNLSCMEVQQARI